MRASAVIMVLGTSLLVVAACATNPSATQPTAPTATYGAYPPGYPPPTDPQNPGAYPPGYPPPPGYATAPPQPYPAPQYAPAPAPTYAPAPQPVYTAQPVPTYAPPAPAPAPAPTGTMATPGLLALPCQSDATCGLHHCNTQAGKCAFPCQTAVDCLQGNGCVMGVCVPGAG